MTYYISEREEYLLDEIFEAETCLDVCQAIDTWKKDDHSKSQKNTQDSDPFRAIRSIISRWERTNWNENLDSSYEQETVECRANNMRYRVNLAEKYRSIQLSSDSDSVELNDNNQRGAALSEVDKIFEKLVYDGKSMPEKFMQTSGALLSSLKKALIDFCTSVCSFVSACHELRTSHKDEGNHGPKQ